MKILHVVASYVPAWRYGGPVQSVSALCQGLARVGEDVTVFTTNINGVEDLPVPVGRSVLVNGVKVQYFQVRPPRHWSFSLGLTRALAKSVRDFDLVHIHSVFVYPALAAGFFCRKYRVPYVVSPRGMLCRVAYGRKPLRKRVYFKLLERKNLDSARAIHFTTDEELRQSVAVGRLNVIVPNGLDLEEYDSLPPYGTFRRRHPETFGKSLVIFLGRIHEIKGLDRLVEAFYSLAQIVPEAHLVIAGYDREGYGSVVRRRLEDRRLLTKVTFSGPLVGPDKLSALRDSDVFVMPSYQENFGMAALDAMACGLPVVVSKGVYLYPEVERAGAGLVVDGEPEGLAEALKGLLENESLRGRMGEAGRKLVRSSFSSTRVAEQMRAVYRSLLANGEVRGETLARDPRPATQLGCHVS